MERVYFLLLLVSSTLCTGNCSHIGPGESLAVCRPDTCTLISEVATMKEKLSAMTQKQSKLEENLSSMTKELASITSASTAKVAFTAILGHSLGPVGDDTTVKYQKIVSNIGNSYNPATGIFTAMVPGVYYFRYTMYNNNYGTANSILSLMMNNQKLVSTWDTVGGDVHDSATNAAVVKLKVGDSVYVKLWSKRQVYDDSNHYNTFSGFLLFTL
ncbi:complement C1q-like protein 3 [Scomber scombrus]|uniref:complement C1q-like protein 3 n=1 Tax=Scomber scombrus TaxID=13677 RepID=UPI002DD8112C|nr:complement C1q-like protein 3 [Scomber scombrus]